MITAGTSPLHTERSDQTFTGAGETVDIKALRSAFSFAHFNSASARSKRESCPNTSAHTTNKHTSKQADQNKNKKRKKQERKKERKKESKQENKQKEQTYKQANKQNKQTNNHTNKRTEAVSAQIPRVIIVGKATLSSLGQLMPAAMTRIYY